MITGQHGELLLSFGSRKRLLNFANGAPGLFLPRLPRRSLYTTLRMTGRSSPHPHEWKLWHPTNGVVFHQRPLYPVLDVARFFTEASSARAVEPETFDVETAALRMPESRVGLRSTVNGVRYDTAREGPSEQDSRPRTGRTSYTTGSGQDIGAEGQENRLDGDSQESVATKVPEVCAADPEAAAESNESPENHKAPFTPLDYKMSHEMFQNARIAKEGSPESYWSYSFYRGPDEDNDVNGRVKVHYCRSAQTAEKALQYLEGEKFLGFDLEWASSATTKAGIRKNISLVQLASQSRVVLLHLALYPENDEFVTATLKKILEDPEVTKLGVWINGDCSRLKKFLGIEVRGKFELSHLFRQVKYSISCQPKQINKRLVALATQVQDIMGLPMFKDQKVRASDWSQRLDLEQIGYSASDAYAAVQLFAMLNHQRENLDRVPPLPFHTELGRPIPVPPGLEPPSEDEALAEDEVADEQEIEAEAAAEAASRDSQAPDVIQQHADKCTKQDTTAARTPPLPKDPRIEAAEAWLKQYREDRGGKTKAPPAAMKAYHIWHTNKDLDCVSIAQVLRDPPLQTSSVAGYILSSVHMEKLPYDKARMSSDVMIRMPGDLVRKRFFTLWAAVQGPRAS